MCSTSRNEKNNQTFPNEGPSHTAAWTLQSVSAIKTATLLYYGDGLAKCRGAVPYVIWAPNQQAALKGVLDRALRWGWRLRHLGDCVVMVTLVLALSWEGLGGGWGGLLKYLWTEGRNVSATESQMAQPRPPIHLRVCVQAH